MHKYRIRNDLCKACMICVNVCPEGAISQLPDKTLAIDYGLCTSCGLCYENCKLRVITKSFSPHLVSK